MKKLIKKLFALTLTAALCFSLTACGDNGLNGWKTVAKTASSDGVKLEYVAKLEFSSGSILEVREAWFNASGLKGDASINVTLLNYTTKVKEIKDFAVTSATLKESKNGWVNLLKGVSYKCNKVLITTCDTISLNEIVFIGEDGKLIDLSFTEGGVRPSGSENGNIYSESELNALTEKNPAYSEHPAYNLIDEQDKFPTELITFKAEGSSN